MLEGYIYAFGPLILSVRRHFGMVRALCEAVSPCLGAKRIERERDKQCFHVALEQALPGCSSSFVHTMPTALSTGPVTALPGSGSVAHSSPPVQNAILSHCLRSQSKACIRRRSAKERGKE